MKALNEAQISKSHDAFFLVPPPRSESRKKKMNFGCGKLATFSEIERREHGLDQGPQSLPDIFLLI